MCICANANAILLSFQIPFSLPGKKENADAESLIWNGVSDINMHFCTVPRTVVCAEHRLRSHSDERPSLPSGDVPSSQTPCSHHAPVTVAAYSRAHRPQGPGQGGQQTHINIFFHAAAE